MHLIKCLSLPMATYFFCLFSAPLIAQKGENEIISPTELTVMIDSIGTILENSYVSYEVGKKAKKFIHDKHIIKGYQGMTYKTLGKVLTDDLRTICDDDHMSAFYRKKETRLKKSLLTEKLSSGGQIGNYGHQEIKILEGNIGYLKLNHFSRWEYLIETKKAIDNSMSMLANTDAIIVDVRNNGGGHEEVVAYLLSYFFNGESFVLSDYYCKYINSRSSVSTTTELAGKALPDIPLYILTNRRTASAAESFAYMAKHTGRGIVLGDTTMGAGNGATYFSVSDEFVIQVAVCETINAITKTSFEKVGVIPDVVTSSEDVFDKAYELAKVMGGKYRTKKKNEYTRLYTELNQALISYKTGEEDKAISNALAVCNTTELLSESEINNLGYEYLRKDDSDIAEVIFRTNTVLFPKSANVYDSYADALKSRGKYEMAKESLLKAIKIAKEKGDTNLVLFKRNLDKVEEMLKD